MIIRVHPSALRGEIVAPPSKSVMQRLIAGALLAKGTSTLYNISQSDDCTAAMIVASQLGASIEIGENTASISGTAGRPALRVEALTPGESGLAARLFLPLAGLTDPPVTMEAEGTLKGRPMNLFEFIFASLGGKFIANAGSFPVRIEQGLNAGTVTIEDPVSSQFITGLLFALPVLQADSVIRVVHPVSQPYIQMTLEILEDFGIQIESRSDFSEFRIPGNQSYKSLETVIDGDWSSAAAMAVAGMVCAEQSITINGLNNQYSQADEAIRGALLFAGGALSGTEEGMQVARRPVRPFTVDLSECPDLFPVLAALAAFGKKPSKLIGIDRLIHKESNRAEAIERAWNQLDIPVQLETESNALVVHPWSNKPDQPVKLNPRGDHRLVMAFSILALGGNCPLDIADAQCVAKSYPEFFDDLEILGGRLEILRHS